MALRQQVLLAGVGATGVQVPGHQDKGRNASKVWVVILGFRPTLCLMDSSWQYSETQAHKVKSLLIWYSDSTVSRKAISKLETRRSCRRCSIPAFQSLRVKLDLKACTKLLVQGLHHFLHGMTVHMSGGTYRAGILIC